MSENNLGKIGFVGRFKPLHNGAALMLEHMCQKAEHVKIGIGSCNKYSVRNPFTAEESREMIDAYLRQRFDNYEFIFVPDFAHIHEYSDGQKWREYVLGKYGALDNFVSSNPFVIELLKNDYQIIAPSSLIPKELWIPIRATQVRIVMAQGRDYRKMVPEVVVEYLEKNGLIKRFRKEFGLATLTQLVSDEYIEPGKLAEKKHAMET